MPLSQPERRRSAFPASRMPGMPSAIALKDQVDLELGQVRAEAAAAKAYYSETLARMAGEMIQLHGAIGITWEHDAHRYFKRAHGAAHLFGRPSEHVARIAAARSRSAARTPPPGCGATGRS